MQNDHLHLTGAAQRHFYVFAPCRQIHGLSLGDWQVDGDRRPLPSHTVNDSDIFVPQKRSVISQNAHTPTFTGLFHNDNLCYGFRGIIVCTRQPRNLHILLLASKWTSDGHFVSFDPWCSGYVWPKCDGRLKIKSAMFNAKQWTNIYRLNVLIYISNSEGNCCLNIKYNRNMFHEVCVFLKC